MPRFVILQHEMPATSLRQTHWDFMLEDGPSLLTWALTSPAEPHRLIEATQLPAHRTRYLDYEGAVSGDRGSVRRWDQGTFEWGRRSSEGMFVKLWGERLRGDATLQPANSRPHPDLSMETAWLFRYQPWSDQADQGELPFTSPQNDH